MPCVSRDNPSLLSSWQRLVRKQPRACAVIEAETGGAYSRQQISERSEQLVAQLSMIQKGDIVAFSLPNSMEWIALFTAILGRGGIAMALDYDGHETARICATEFRANWWWNGATAEFLRKRGQGRKISGCLTKITSGSTGEPKPLVFQDSHMLADGRNILRTMRIRSDDCNLGLIPLGHSYGLGNLLMPLFIQGTPLVVARNFVPFQIRDWLSKYPITIFPTVPMVLKLLSETAGRFNPGKLRLVISAGAILDGEIAKAFYKCSGIHVHNFYGSSETGGICYDKNGKSSLSGRSVGTPLHGVRVKVTRGRIAVEGSAVGTPKGKFLLKDLGEFLPNGELKIIGRAGKVANAGGRKIKLEEVTARLRSLPGVGDAWVDVLRKGERDYLIAAVESARPVKELAAELAKRLPPWKIPRRLVALGEFPRNSRGKVDRKALQSRVVF